ncbi:FLgD tudor-like domain-containing protein [Legionella sp. CNM-4043-24]|uniref:FLgD tudor-like domain-containing protein n=1 Tax=Legionella sp. CNM-4043-24 TaxID=3421646 RepID=UPI00403ADF26
MATNRKQPVFMQSNQALQASAFVGCRVMVVLDAQKSMIEPGSSVFIDVPEAVRDAQLMIYALSGRMKEQIWLDSLSPGLLPLSQYLPPDACRLAVLATDSELPIMLSANVDSVSLGKNGSDLRLNVAGVGEVALERLRFYHPECHERHPG